MIDPANITDYTLSDTGLEEQLLFWICAAGKTAKTAARGLDLMLKTIDGVDKPFAAIRKYVAQADLSLVLKTCGIGCFNDKAETIKQLAFSRCNLRLCSTNDLELVRGIGPKTSRCFMLHTRKNARVAGLDTHMLKFLKSKGHDVPASTPGSKKQYAKLEKLFLKYADEAGLSPADFDLQIWRSYAG